MDEYPSEQDLKTIEAWDCIKDPEGLLEFIRPFWEHYGFLSITGKKVKRVSMSTGGWSGNEDIIGAMYKNHFFLFWFEQENRGGHYKFKIKHNPPK